MCSTKNSLHPTVRQHFSKSQRMKNVFLGCSVGELDDVISIFFFLVIWCFARLCYWARTSTRKNRHNSFHFLRSQEETNKWANGNDDSHFIFCVNCWLWVSDHRAILGQWPVKPKGFQISMLKSENWINANNETKSISIRCLCWIQRIQFARHRAMHTIPWLCSRSRWDEKRRRTRFKIDG